VSFALTGDYLAEDPKCIYKLRETGRVKRPVAPEVAVPNAPVSTPTTRPSAVLKLFSMDPVTKVTAGQNGRL
jgi:hypothetical protein